MRAIYSDTTVKFEQILIAFFFNFQGVRDGSGDVSPKDTKASDLISEADSNDGHASGTDT